MAIMAALGGIGFGVYQNLSGGDRMARAQVLDAMHAARSFAQRERAPSKVVLDPDSSRIFASGLRTVGNWHFEDEEGTGWPDRALYDPGSLIRDGLVGSGLRLTADRPLAIPRLPSSFDSPMGFGVDVYLAPEEDPRPMVLLERPGCWRLLLDGRDQLVVQIALEGQGAEVELFETTLKTPPLKSWLFTRLTVVFDGRSLHVALNGVRAVEDTVFEGVRQLVVRENAPIHTGEGPLRYRGKMDELRILSVVSAESEPLPTGVTISGEARLIHIDGYGHLDRSYHGGPVEVALDWGEPPQRTIVEMGLFGTTALREDSP